jgi:hypothetical protein
MSLLPLFHSTTFYLSVTQPTLFMPPVPWPYSAKSPSPPIQNLSPFSIAYEPKLARPLTISPAMVKG